MRYCEVILIEKSNTGRKGDDALLVFDKVVAFKMLVHAGSQIRFIRPFFDLMKSICLKMLQARLNFSFLTFFSHFFLLFTSQKERSSTGSGFEQRELPVQYQVQVHSLQPQRITSPLYHHHGHVPNTSQRNHLVALFIMPQQPRQSISQCAEGKRAASTVPAPVRELHSIDLTSCTLSPAVMRQSSCASRPGLHKHLVN